MAAGEGGEGMTLVPMCSLAPVHLQALHGAASGVGFIGHWMRNPCCIHLFAVLPSSKVPEDMYSTPVGIRPSVLVALA